MEERLCSMDGCGKPHEARGWCHAHYTRWRLHGDPLAGRKTMDGAPARFFREVVMRYEGDECLTWPFAGSDGYGLLWFDGRSQKVSRLVCEEEHGPPPTPKHQAAHSCGKGHLACVTKRHLSWKTPKENVADQIIHGTQPRGERSGRALLNETNVRAIREMRERGATHRAIAETLKVNKDAVRNVLRGRAWAWL